MNTEITDNRKLKGWVLYDADCRLCVATARRLRGLLAARHFELLPLQTPWVRARLGLSDTELVSEMRLLKPSGNTFGGADALVEISRHFWWAWPYRLLSRFPITMNWLRASYRWVADNRTCANNTCAAKEPAVRSQHHLHLVDFLPLLLLPALALTCRTHMAPWIFMWATAFALYAGCKWLTYREAASRRSTALRRIGYLMAWPGMDASRFLDPCDHPAKPRRVEWFFALAKMAFGLILLWGIARTAFPVHPLLTGWLGMMGVIFILHFGGFHVLALVWRHAGVEAAPVMQNPLRANSLTEFWGRRWNTAFKELAFRFTYRPIRRLTAPAIATLLVFVLSGLIHELVISVPAGRGYGLPTAYFFVQGLGVITERSPLGRKLGLGHGLLGWFFTVVVTAGPVFWLFHPPFIKNVILPMLTAIGAT